MFNYVGFDSLSQMNTMTNTTYLTSFFPSIKKPTFCTDEDYFHFKPLLKTEKFFTRAIKNKNTCSSVSIVPKTLKYFSKLFEKTVHAN